MDPNRYYCRSNNIYSNTNHQYRSHSPSSSSSVSSSAAAAAAIAAAAATAAAATAASSNIGRHHDAVTKSRSHHLNRGTNTGNYINVVPVPIGVQYHRRKLAPQEYTSRLYYNGTDYRLREDYYNLATTSGRLRSASTSPSLQGHQSSPSSHHQTQQLQHHHSPQIHHSHSSLSSREQQLTQREQQESHHQQQQLQHRELQNHHQRHQLQQRDLPSHHEPPLTLREQQQQLALREQAQLALREQAQQQLALREQAQQQLALREQAQQQLALREQAQQQLALREQAQQQLALREQAQQQLALREQQKQQLALREQQQIALRDQIALREQQQQQLKLREQQQQLLTQREQQQSHHQHQQLQHRDLPQLHQSKLLQHHQSQQHHQHHHLHQKHQQHHHTQQQQQQQQQQQNHQQTHHQQQQQHHHQHTRTTDIIDEVLNSSRVVATQTNGNIEQIVPTVFSNSTSGVGGGGSSASSLPPPPMMYTVHRVVTTAQIQTAGGNTFASSSSVSSVVSSLRGNEPADRLTANKASGVGGVGGTAAAVAAAKAAAITSAASLRSSPGISTNSNYQPHQQPSCSSEIQQQQQQQQHQQPQASSSRISNNFNSTTSSSTSTSNTNYSSGAKSSTSIPRPLQNVIPTCVYLMSRIAVHMEIEGTAQCPSQVMLAAALGCEELGIANKLLAQSIFGLWMTSALLEIQLKSHHRPYVVRIAWQSLLEKFSHGNPIEKTYDEPMIMLKRNVFFSKKDEEKIKDHRILELLYEEAKHNVLTGRYIMEPVHSIMLGGIQSRIELGPYNSHTHTISFFRENQSRFLPQHVAKNSSWSWLPVSRKTSAEVKLLEQYKRVPQTATTRKLMRKYLEFCWALPFYGAAFFHGQVEQPVRGLMSLVNHKDVSVIVAINERGIFIIDPVEYTLLLGLRYEDLSWDFAKPSASDDPECQTCIFLQFDAVENGIQVSKLMQIFSRQAAMMDALIAHFADQMRRRRESADGSEHIHDEPNPIQNNGNGVLCNKLSRLTLATFDDEGRCIGQMGSLSISY